MQRCHRVELHQSCSITKTKRRDRSTMPFMLLKHTHINYTNTCSYSTKTMQHASITITNQHSLHHRSELKAVKIHNQQQNAITYVFLFSTCWINPHYPHSLNTFQNSVISDAIQYSWVHLYHQHLWMVGEHSLHHCCSFFAWVSRGSKRWKYVRAEVFHWQS